METRNLLVVGAWAVGTFAALAAVTPVALQADQGVAKAAEIQTPKLKVNGCELSLEQGTDDAGMAGLKLVMLNPTSSSVDIKCKVRQMVEPPTDPRSRVRMMPTENWSEENDYSLAPGDRKEVALHPTKPVPVNGHGYFTIESGAQHVVALQLASNGFTPIVSPRPLPRAQ